MGDAERDTEGVIDSWREIESGSVREREREREREKVSKGERDRDEENKEGHRN